MNDNLLKPTITRAVDAQRVERLQEKQQEYHLVGQVLKRAGHTLFEYNKKTHKVRIADIFHSAAITVYGNVQHETRCNANNECIYLQALNLKNAIRHLTKAGYAVSL